MKWLEVFGLSFEILQPSPYQIDPRRSWLGRSEQVQRTRQTKIYRHRPPTQRKHTAQSSPDEHAF
jgi:hypothetical protein